MYYFSNIHQQVIKANTNYAQINGLSDIVIFSNINNNVLFITYNVVTPLMFIILFDLHTQEPYGVGRYYPNFTDKEIEPQGEFHGGNQEEEGLKSKPNSPPSLFGSPSPLCHQSQEHLRFGGLLRKKSWSFDCSQEIKFNDSGTACKANSKEIGIKTSSGYC